jgi:hypothetical protein
MKSMADATQLLTVGIPTLAVLVGILINNSRLSDIKSYMDNRFEDARRYSDSMFKMIIDKLEAERRYNDAMFKTILEKLDDIEARFAR